MSNKRPIGKQKQIEIEVDKDTIKKVMLYEIRPIDVIELFNSVEKDQTLESITEKVLNLCSSLSLEELKTFYPSDIERLYEAFKEINSPFVRFSSRLNLLENLKKAIGQEKIQTMRNEFLGMFQKLYQEGMNKLSTTDGVTTS